MCMHAQPERPGSRTILDLTSGFFRRLTALIAVGVSRLATRVRRYEYSG